MKVSLLSLTVHLSNLKVDQTVKFSLVFVSGIVPPFGLRLSLSFLVIGRFSSSLSSSFILPYFVRGIQRTASKVVWFPDTWVRLFGECKISYPRMGGE